MNSMIAGYLVVAAMRDRLIFSLLGACVLVVSTSFFFGSSAITEQDQFVLVYIASTIRLLFVFGLVLFTVFFIRRSFDNKDIEYLLSRPIGRKRFVSSYIVGLVGLSAFFSLIGALVISLVGKNYLGDGYFLWCYSLFIELVIMSVAALFFSMALSTAISATLVTFAFYALSRLIGELLSISAGAYTGTASEVMSNTINTVSLFVPRFDLLTQSEWLLYGLDGSVGYVLVTVQGVIFIMVLAAAAMIDLIRKQF